MEQQSISLRMQSLAIVINASHLPGCNKHQCSFLIVIFTAPVSNRSMNLLLQENRIKPKTFATMFQHFDF